MNIIKVLLVSLVFGSVFACGMFNDAYILPKWLFFIFSCSLFVPAFLTIGVKGIDKRYVSSILSFAALTLCAICFWEHATGAWDAQNGPVATFDNVAGVMVCLIPMLAYIVYGFGGKCDKIKKLSVALILFCTLVLKSRTGILATFLPMMLYTFLSNGCDNKTGWKKKWHITFCLFMTLLCITMTGGKMDSAKGRLLIWEVTIRMLPEALPFGFGVGGFERNYMNYQAKYFKHHTDSAYAMLADNTSTPFNEYLHLIVDYGLIGVIVFVALTVLYVRWYRICASNKRYVSLCSILSIGILSMFSYPFLYPFTWVMFALNFLCIMPQSYWDILTKYRKYIVICLIPFAIYVVSYTVKRGIEEWQWKIYCEMDHTKRKINTAMKSELDATFIHNPYYNYAEAVEKYELKDYVRTLQNLAACEKHIADYDVQLLKTQALMHLKMYSDAEQCAKQAHYMCPNRFYPLYYLALAYYAENRTNQMRQVCNQIQDKKVKVNSWDVMVIKRLAVRMNAEKNLCVESLLDF